MIAGESLIANTQKTWKVDETTFEDHFDIILYVCEFLDSRDLSTLSLASTLLYTLSSSPFLWEKLCVRWTFSHPHFKQWSLTYLLNHCWLGKHSLPFYLIPLSADQREGLKAGAQSPTKEIEVSSRRGATDPNHLCWINELCCVSPEKAIDSGECLSACETRIAYPAEHRAAIIGQNIWRLIYNEELYPDSMCWKLSNVRCIWKVRLPDLFCRRSVSLRINFDLPAILDGSSLSSHTVFVTLVLEESRSKAYDFWAKKLDSTPLFGGFQVSITKPVYDLNTPARSNAQLDATTLCKTLWKVHGSEWGWKSLFESKSELESYAHQSHIFLDITWFHPWVSLEHYVSRGICSSLLTGQAFAIQPWYRCLTCTEKLRCPEGPNAKFFGCCAACAKTCHGLHQVQFESLTVCSCDCGASQALSKKVDCFISSLSSSFGNLP